MVILLKRTIFIQFILCLSDTSKKTKELDVPSVAFVGETVVLSCYLNLSSDKLYSKKWYKNGQEIIRYSPSENQLKFFDVRQLSFQVDLFYFINLLKNNIFRLVLSQGSSINLEYILRVFSKF